MSAPRRGKAEISGFAHYRWPSLVLRHSGCLCSSTLAADANVGVRWIRRFSPISVAADRRQSATRRLLDLHQDIAGILGAEVRHSGRHVHRAEAGPAH